MLVVEVEEVEGEEQEEEGAHRWQGQEEEEGEEAIIPSSRLTLTLTIIITPHSALGALPGVAAGVTILVITPAGVIVTPGEAGEAQEEALGAVEVEEEGEGGTHSLQMVVEVVRVMAPWGAG